MENHHFQWVNPLFQWQFSIAITTINQWESMDSQWDRLWPPPPRSRSLALRHVTQERAVAFSMDPKRDVSNGF